MRHNCLRLPVLLATLPSSILLAQVAPATFSPSETRPEVVVELDPFTVESDSDSSYGATNSLTATRMAREIKDIPLAISVVTAEFLQDTGATTFTDAFKYVPSLVPDARSEGEAPGVFGSVLGYARGFPLSATMRNGVSRSGGLSLYNVERVEVLKGPVSVFFGASEPGGTVNYITKRPTFKSFTSVSAELRSFELSGEASPEQQTNTVQYSIEHEGVLGSSIGYRLYAQGHDGNLWRDNEYHRSNYIAGSLRWRLNSKLQFFAEYEFQKTDSNPAAQTAVVNPDYVADYANPPADVLAFHGLTEAQFRTRIFGSSTNWRNLKLAARGNTPEALVGDNIWRTSLVGVGAYPSTFYDRASWSWQGKGHYNDSEAQTFTFETLASPTSWATGRYSLVRSDWDREWIQSFRSETNGDGTFNAASGGGSLSNRVDTTHQLDLILKGRFLGLNHQLLLGAEYRESENVSQSARFDYANRFVTIPGRDGTLLTGLNAWRLWDPLLSPSVPDLSLAFANWNAPGREESELDAIFGSWQGEFTVAGRRVLPSFGYRRETLESYGISNAGVRSERPASSGNSYTYGLVVALSRSINAYASYNENYKPQVGFLATGPGVNRDTAGNLVDGLQENVPSEDQTGSGWDLGIKIARPDGSFSGSVGWFRVERQDILARDTARTQADPRNTPGTFYPVPPPDGPLQFVDGIGFNPVVFFSNQGLQRNEGIEVEGLWTPNRNWSVVGRVSYTYTSELVNDPALDEPFATIRYSRRLANTPEWRFSLLTRYSFHGGALNGLSLGAGVRGQSKSDPRFNDQDLPELYPGYAVVDLNARYPFKVGDRTYRLGLVVSNAFDKLYFSGVFAYNTPRRISLSINTRF